MNTIKIPSPTEIVSEAYLLDLARADLVKTMTAAEGKSFKFFPGDCPAINSVDVLLAELESAGWSHEYVSHEEPKKFCGHWIPYQPSYFVICPKPVTAAL